MVKRRFILLGLGVGIVALAIIVAIENSMNDMASRGSAGKDRRQGSGAVTLRQGVTGEPDSAEPVLQYEFNKKTGQKQFLR